MLQTCRVTGTNFLVSEHEESVLAQIARSILALGEESLPLPHIHPFERNRRMIAYGSHRYLFRVPSAVSGTMLLTRYNPDLGTKVCMESEFYDAVDNSECGRPVDFGRSFFEQWVELFRDCIHHPRNAANCEDSDYVNGAGNLKSCYLCFAAFDSRDCCYCWLISKCTDCIDLYGGTQCELCVRGVNLTRCYDTQDSVGCNDSRNLIGCFGCDTCTDCIGCAGLYRKRWCLFNREVSEQEYRRFLAECDLASRSGRESLLERCHECWRETSFVLKTVSSSSNSTGAYLDRCENMIDCWNCSASRDCGYVFDGMSAESSYCGVVRRSMYSYDSMSFDSSCNAYCYTVFGGCNNLYSMSLHKGCSECFGCVGLQRKQYCILNQQYSRNEYFDLVPRVVALMKQYGEWGEWFPLQASPHLYHESAVDQYLDPISIAEAARRGYRIGEESEPPAHAGSLRAEDLPDRLTEENLELIMGRPVLSARSGNAFNFQRRELIAYLRAGVPLPTLHWRERMNDALGIRSRMPAI